MKSNRTLLVQLAILAFCVLAVAETVLNFPFPSPLIQPLLPPKLRWPAAEISQWAEAENFDRGFLAFFMRDPERKVPGGDNLVSAADGVVKDIIYKNRTTYFVIGLSFWDVHVVRTPVEGVVRSVDAEGLTFYRGASESADQAYLKGKAGPVQQIVTLATKYGNIKVRLITSYIADRLKVWAREGQHLDKGQRIGRILLGSTVVIEMPGQADFLVHRGQRVVAGETIIFSGERLH